MKFWVSFKKVTVHTSRKLFEGTKPPSGVCVCVCARTCMQKWTSCLGLGGGWEVLMELQAQWCRQAAVGSNWLTDGQAGGVGGRLSQTPLHSSSSPFLSNPAAFTSLMHVTAYELRCHNKDAWLSGGGGGDIFFFFNRVVICHSSENLKLDRWNIGANFSVCAYFSQDRNTDVAKQGV